MKNKELAAGNMPQYTMGVKFQMKMDLNEALTRKIMQKQSDRWTKILLMIGLLTCLLGAALLMSYGPDGFGFPVLWTGVAIVVIGGTTFWWLPKAKMYDYKAKELEGVHKITVYENEFLVYSETYRTCKTFSLRELTSYEREGGLYFLHLGKEDFIFPDDGFISGNPSTFEVFLGEILKKSTDKKN